MADVINAGAPTSVREYPVSFLKRKSAPVVVDLEKGKDFEVVVDPADRDWEADKEADTAPADVLGSSKLPSTSE